MFNDAVTTLCVSPPFQLLSLVSFYIIIIIVIIIIINIFEV